MFKLFSKKEKPSKCGATQLIITNINKNVFVGVTYNKEKHKEPYIFFKCEKEYSSRDIYLYEQMSELFPKAVIIESGGLARALCAICCIDEEIPEELRPEMLEVFGEVFLGAE